MDDTVLFEIKTSHLETGLRGFPIGYCPTSKVHPHEGLSYSGFLIQQLAALEPEEVIYLLFEKEKGSKEKVKSYFSSLYPMSQLKPETVAAIYQLPKAKSAMKLFCAALLTAGMLEATGDYVQDAYRLIMTIPEITAIVINHHAGWSRDDVSKPELGYMENFTQMLGAPAPNRDKLCQAFKLFNILHYDHGGGNLSTFVGKAVASGLEDLYGALASAMCALAGPRHGKANQDALEFLQKIASEAQGAITPQNVEAIIRGKLEKRELIFGFGHAVLRVEDPRATVLYDHLIHNYADHPLVQTAFLLRQEVPKILKENPKITDPYPNVDAASGLLMAVSGFDYPQYFTLLFGMARSVGIARQIVYERTEAREGRGTPIVRPRYLYNGP